MSLLGFLGAGAAAGYVAAKNAETEQLNKLETALFAAEITEMYQQRRDERTAKAEDLKYQRDIGRKDFEYGRDRGDKLADAEKERAFKLEDTQATQAHDLRKLETKYGYDKSLTGMKLAGLEKRAGLRTLGLLNNQSRQSTNDFTAKETAKAIEADQRRAFELEAKLLQDPQARVYLERVKKDPKTPMPESVRIYQNEIDRLKRSVEDKSSIMSMGGGGLNLDGFAF